MEYIYIVRLNGVEVFRFTTPIPLNEDQLEEFNLEIRLKPHQETETIP